MSTQRSPEDARNEARTNDGIPPQDETPQTRPLDDEEIEIADERPAMSRDRVTAAEQREEESLNTRVAREVPDEVPDEVRPIPGRLVEEKTIDGFDVTGQLEAEETGDLTARSSEEEAIHVRDDDERQIDEPSTDEALGRGADRGA